MEFWGEKFITNRIRDAKIESDLKALGWNVIVVWECELKSIGNAIPEQLLSLLVESNA